MTTREEDLPEEVEAIVNGTRTIVTSEGVVFQGSEGQVLCEGIEELREALHEINRFRESLVSAHDAQVSLEKENERLKQAVAYIERHAIEIAVKRECRKALQPNATTTR